MQQALLDQLRKITDEERRILDGEAEVDKDLYIRPGFYCGQSQDAQGRQTDCSAYSHPVRIFSGAQA